MGVWVVEFKSTLFQGWVPVSSVGVHATSNRAKLASRALKSGIKVIRARDLVSGEVVSIRDHGVRPVGVLACSVVTFFLLWCTHEIR